MLTMSLIPHQSAQAVDCIAGACAENDSRLLLAEGLGYVNAGGYRAQRLGCSVTHLDKYKCHRLLSLAVQCNQIYLAIGAVVIATDDP